MRARALDISGDERTAERAASSLRSRAPVALRRQNSLAARIHRWAGLPIGLILAVAGLTGTYLAFYPEIETASIAPLQQSAGEQPESYEAVYQAFMEVGAPARGGWTIELPADGGVITGRFNASDTPLRMVSVDPVTLDVVRDVEWGQTVSTWAYELHYSLLIGPSGAAVMGALGLGALVMILAGLVLWLRSGRTMRGRFGLRRRGSRERKLYDVHRLLGVGAAVLLVVSIATATAMNLPAQVRPLLTAFSPLEEMPDPRSGPANGRTRLPVDEAIAAVRARLPQADVRWVRMPTDEADPYTVRVWQPGEPSFRFPKSYVWLDQYDGSVLAVHHGPRGSASDRILDWLYPLHSGQAFGIGGRSVVALLGLVPAILFITGLIRWRASSARMAAAARHRARR